MAKLNVYLRFNGKCKEAMEFYKEVFGGELELQTIGESPMADGTPENQKNNVMHSKLTTGNDITIMASDMFGDDEIKDGNTMSLCLICTSKEEITTLFDKLSKDGKVTRELKEEFFGTFGQIEDKFGFDWMLQFN
jgi:PhnB protein